ncbi:MAG: homoserine kinase [Eubacteriaceae bacterium]|jgi:homoserine kinase
MFSVRVPATSANIGAGFDTFGAAFSFFNTFEFEEQENGKLTIRGVGKKYQGKDNLVYQAMQKVFREVGYKPKGIYIHEHTDIPVGRGLGSSATCIVAGLVGANIIAGSPLSMDRLFEIGVRMEGHPDNIAPAFFGGLVTSVMTPHKTFYIKEEISPLFSFYACIPDFKLPTVKARAVLPDKVPRADAVYNISRANMTYLALTRGLPELIGVSVNDKLHQPYRKGLIHHYKDVTRTARRMGALNTYLSGAGPTIMLIAEAKNTAFPDKMGRWMQANLPGWDFRRLKQTDFGVAVKEVRK